MTSKDQVKGLSKSDRSTTVFVDPFDTGSGSLKPEGATPKCRSTVLTNRRHSRAGSTRSPLDASESRKICAGCERGAKEASTGEQTE